METCCICGCRFDVKNDGGGCEEGTDDWWCLDCIDKWEIENGTNWADGAAKE